VRDSAVFRYKIPLIQLQQGTMVKQLKAAGVQIAATAEQARSLSALKPLLTISDATQSTLDESQTNTQEVQEMIGKISSQEDESKEASFESAAIAAVSEDSKAEMVEEEENWEDYKDPQDAQGKESRGRERGCWSLRQKAQVQNCITSRRRWARSKICLEVLW
jgi:hypothetical protein